MTLAGVIRLYGLDAKSFWFDEFLTAHAARISNWDDLVAWWRLWIDHPPLQTWLTWLLRPLGGDEFVVRVPVALASTGAVGVMYALGATMYRPRVGVVSALMLTLSPYAVWYGQEARPYAFILLLTLLQMLFAARVARRGLLRDWTTLGAVTILALYTSYLAIATTGAVVAYLAFRAIAPTMDASDASAAARPGPSESRLDRRSFALHGIATGVVVGLAYLPWLPFLLAFVSRPDLGFGRIDTSHRPTLDEVTALLRSVDLGDVIVVALMVAGVLVSVGAVRRGRWRSSALLGCWLGVGLGILIVRAHGGVVTIWPRYLVYLAPAGLLLAAVGVDGIATTASHFVPARRSVVTAMVVFVALTFTVLLPAPRRVGEAYTAAKGEDYRGAARLIAEGTRPGAVVLAVLANSDWLAFGLDHELWVDASATRVFDANAIDPVALDALENGTSLFVANFVRPGDAVPGSTTPPGWTATSVDGIRIHHPAPGVSAIQAAESALAWAAPSDQRLDAASLVVEGAAAGARSPDLLGRLPAAAWSVPAGATIDDDGGVQIAASGPELDVTATVPVTDTAQSLILTFECRSRLEGGSLQFYVSAHDEHEAWLSIFPTGFGYRCPGNTRFHRGAFVVAPPPGLDHLIVRIRATGKGFAEARSVRLSEARPLDRASVPLPTAQPGPSSR